MKPARLVWAGFAIIFVGFLVVIAGGSLEKGFSGSSGGFILVGPIPIVFGSGSDSGMLASVALAITLVMVIAYLVSFFLGARGRRGAEVGAESMLSLNHFIPYSAEYASW
jgi:uncharacterized membrane protein